MLTEAERERRRTDVPNAEASDFGDLLSRAVAWVKANLGDGPKCPCCGQDCKLYERKLNSGMARALISLYHACARGDVGAFHHFYEVKNRAGVKGNDYGFLKWWKLVEKAPRDPEDTKRRTNGLWRITELGRDFVEGRKSMPRHALCFDDTFYGFTQEVTDIGTALGDDFDYQELMAAPSSSVRP